MHDRGSKPYGMPWEEWAVLWWKWCSLEPDDTNPAADATGINCCKNQTNKYAWFLAGTFGGSAERYCILPKKKSVLFPIITDRISYVEHPHLSCERALSDYAKSDLDTTTICNASLDAQLLPHLHNYRVRTGLFSFSCPESQMRNKPSRVFQAVSDGYWVFLQPLVIGKHTLCFVGEKLKYDEAFASGFRSETHKFRVEVKYNLSVQ